MGFCQLRRFEGQRVVTAGIEGGNNQAGQAPSHHSQHPQRQWFPAEYQRQAQETRKCLIWCLLPGMERFRWQMPRLHQLDFARGSFLFAGVVVPLGVIITRPVHRLLGGIHNSPQVRIILQGLLNRLALTPLGRLRLAQCPPLAHRLQDTPSIATDRRFIDPEEVA